MRWRARRRPRRRPNERARAARRMTAGLEVAQSTDGAALLRLSGRLDAYTVPAVWPRALQALETTPDRALVVDCNAVEYCDGAGVAMLIDLLRRPRPDGNEVRIENLADEYRSLLEQFDPADYRPERIESPPRRIPLIARLGHAGAVFAREARAQIGFLGSAAAALVAAIHRPATTRWRDVLTVAEEAGVNALPIVSLIAFLLGVILTFQSAVAMRPFGAEVYVANLVGLSLLRELGPLMTAILLAGRSSAAFAAELGTMKVGDEINALDTMGIDPTRFLVVPRLLAGVVVAPLLTVYANLIGLGGSAMVMGLFDIPFVTFVQQVTSTVSAGDFLGGLAKSVVFGAVIAGIGCMRGMEAGNGAEAVGRSTTSAVVSGLVLIVAIDGLFAVLYYHLGI